MKTVTVHDRCDRPPSSPTMRGSAVETMFWSSAAMAIAIINPANTRTISRRVGGGAASSAGRVDMTLEPNGRRNGDKPAPP